jgi:hypothetical protein
MPHVDDYVARIEGTCGERKRPLRRSSKKGARRKLNDEVVRPFPSTLDQAPGSCHRHPQPCFISGASDVGEEDDVVERQQPRVDLGFPFVDIQAGPGDDALAKMVARMSNLEQLTPLGAVKVGLIEGRYVVNPTSSELDLSPLNLTVVSNDDGIVMIDAPGLRPVDAFAWKKEIAKFGQVPTSSTRSCSTSSPRSSSGARAFSAAPARSPEPSSAWS